MKTLEQVRKYLEELKTESIDLYDRAHERSDNSAIYENNGRREICEAVLEYIHSEKE